MKGQFGLAEILGTGILGSSAIVLMAAMPSDAAVTQVTGVRVNRTTAGLEVVLTTRNGERPQVFTTSRGNTLVADLINTQLRLPEGGNGFLQNSPAPGIASVIVSQLDANSIRVAVTGENSAPTSQMSQSPQGLVFSVGTAVAQGRQPAQPGRPGPGSIAQTPPAPAPAAPTPPSAPVLVPNPEVLIDGNRVSAPTPGVPPLLPRAIAPPVGDIAVATTDPTPDLINLATNEVVPRLVLRDAPVREVLSLLARAAGYNVAYTDTPAAQQPGQQQGEAATTAQNRISLDIENEPVQNVFNYVLRISGLEANLIGRTIFVGNRLPNSARGTVVRTLRLNQVAISSALNFLVGLGAETAVSRVRQEATVVAIPVTGVGEGAGASGINQVQTTQVERIETQRVNFQDSTPILRGLQVIGDERTNSLTLVGTPRSVEIATAQLVQLDIRRRQVAVNVRVIDVDLSSLNNTSGSFTLQTGNFGITTEDPITGGAGLLTALFDNTADFDFRIGARLQSSVNNGNAKVLTDPTLVVQEGQTSEVRLTEEVITNFRRTVTRGDGTSEVSIEIEKEPAGLILQIRVDRIDDNGFVTLSVAPSVTAIGSTEEVELEGNTNQIVLLAERRLTTGQIRIRDGQTLVLSGIIRDSDRTDVRKVPILGDIPILGALFRRTVRTNERQEVIVVLSPQILDDSDASTFGYRYTPSEDTQRFLRQRGVQSP